MKKNLTTFVLLFTFACFVITNHCQAQKLTKNDSLIIAVKTMPDDTNKLKMLSDIVDDAPDGVWQKYNTDMATLVNKLIADKNAAIKSVAKKYLAVYNNNLGFDYMQKGDFKTALNYYLESEKVQKEIGDKDELGAVTANIGTVYYRNHDYGSALESFRRALKLFEEVKDFGGQISVLNNVALIYIKKKNNDSAAYFFDKALKLSISENIKNEATSILYNCLGSIKVSDGNYSEALEYFNGGLKIAKEGGYKDGESANLSGIAQVCYDKGEYLKSLSYSRQSLVLAKQTENADNIKEASALLFRSCNKIW